MIELHNVSKILRKTTILDGISITFQPGCVSALVGPNGSGKTMLMRHIAGLVTPTRGRVLIDGMCLGQDLDFPPSIGILLEGPSFQDAHSGFENLRSLASIRGRASEEQIRNWMRKVGLDPNNQKKYRAYSLGMKQRLGIACALMEEADIVLLDEPTNALDGNGIATAKELIIEARNRGATVVLACHDACLVEEVADEIWHLAEGHIDSHTIKRSSAQ